MTNITKPIDGVWIELKPEDVELFKRFQQYQDVFCFFLDHGLFNYQDGSIHLHYNHDGRIMKIEKWKVEVL